MQRRKLHARAAAFSAMLLASACSPVGTSTSGLYPVDDGDGDGVATSNPTGSTPPSDQLAPNGTARVSTDFLNLRDLAGSEGNILTVMPCGVMVNVIAGPSTSPVAGWWRVLYTDDTNTPYSGWASGSYLIGAGEFDASVCGGTQTGGGDAGVDGGTVSTDDGGATQDAGPLYTDDGGVFTPPTSTPTSAVFDRAKLGVGYSYWWGHGGWAGTGASLGSCSGNCPSCTHSGNYGADCSGFVSKVWQVPTVSTLPVDQHPYSTDNFYNDQTLWTQIDRSNIAPADAMVRRVGSEGHIVLFESGDDPYGDVWIYEARGCATGIQHNLRTIDSSYRTIHLNSL